jgi:hypothetical protein
MKPKAFFHYFKKGQALKKHWSTTTHKFGPSQAKRIKNTTSISNYKIFWIL